jgi:nitrate/nitrite-specific signal transduction histidine kinase
VHIPVRVADALFHIGREAIVNSVRHADPTQIVLSIDYEMKHITVVVEDEGRGFDPKQQTRGFGLRGMEKRARSIGAQLTVTSEAGKGTRIEARAPLKEHMSTHGLWGTLWGWLRRAKAGDRAAWAQEPAVRESGSRSG